MRFVLLLALAAATQVPQVPSDTCIPCHDAAARDSHPYGVVYRPGRIGNGSWLRPGADALLVDGRVECVSCHRTHDEDAGEQKARLRMTERELCLTCHRVE